MRIVLSSIYDVAFEEACSMFEAALATPFHEGDQAVSVDIPVSDSLADDLLLLREIRHSIQQKMAVLQDEITSLVESTSDRILGGAVFIEPLRLQLDKAQVEAICDALEIHADHPDREKIISRMHGALCWDSGSRKVLLELVQEDSWPKVQVEAKTDLAERLGLREGRSSKTHLEERFHAA